MSATSNPETTSQLIIRDACPSDLPALREIYNYYVLNSTATFDTNIRSSEAQQDWYAQHEAAGLPVLVAEYDGVIVGWASLSYYHSRCAYRSTVEPSLYLSRQFVGRGLGKSLLQALLAAGREKEYHCVVVLVCSENEPSLKLLAGFDFREVGTLREVGKKFDRWLDVTIVQKLL